MNSQRTKRTGCWKRVTALAVCLTFLTQQPLWPVPDAHALAPKTIFKQDDRRILFIKAVIDFLKDHVAQARSSMTLRQLYERIKNPRTAISKGLYLFGIDTRRNAAMVNDVLTIRGNGYVIMCYERQGTREREGDAGAKSRFLFSYDIQSGRNELPPVDEARFHALARRLLSPDGYEKYMRILEHYRLLEDETQFQKNKDRIVARAGQVSAFKHVAEVYGVGYPFYGNVEIRRRMYNSLLDYAQGAYVDERSFLFHLLPDIDLIVITSMSPGVHGFTVDSQLRTDADFDFSVKTELFVKPDDELVEELRVLKYADAPARRQHLIDMFLESGKLHIDFVPIPYPVWRYVPLFVLPEDVQNIYFVKDLLFTCEDLGFPKTTENIPLEFRLNYLIRRLISNPGQRDAFLNAVAEAVPHRMLVRSYPDARAGLIGKFAEALDEGIGRGWIAQDDRGLISVTEAGDNHLAWVREMRQEVMSREIGGGEEGYEPLLRERLSARAGAAAKESRKKGVARLLKRLMPALFIVLGPLATSAWSATPGEFMRENITVANLSPLSVLAGMGILFVMWGGMKALELIAAAVVGCAEKFFSRTRYPDIVEEMMTVGIFGLIGGVFGLMVGGVFVHSLAGIVTVVATGGALMSALVMMTYAAKGAASSLYLLGSDTAAALGRYGVRIRSAAAAVSRLLSDLPAMSVRGYEKACRLAHGLRTQYAYAAATPLLIEDAGRRGGVLMGRLKWICGALLAFYFVMGGGVANPSYVDNLGYEFMRFYIPLNVILPLIVYASGVTIAYALMEHCAVWMRDGMDLMLNSDRYPELSREVYAVGFSGLVGSFFGMVLAACVSLTFQGIAGGIALGGGIGMAVMFGLYVRSGRRSDIYRLVSSGLASLGPVAGGFGRIMRTPLTALSRRITETGSAVAVAAAAVRARSAEIARLVPSAAGLEQGVRETEPVPVSIRLRADGFISQGSQAVSAFMTQIPVVRKNDITGLLRERVLRNLRRALDHPAVPAPVKAKIGAEIKRMKQAKIYGFHAVVRGPDDFLLGWNNSVQGQMYVAQDVVERLAARGPPSLVDEYLIHEVLCSVTGHYPAIPIQQQLYPEHYPPAALASQTAALPSKGFLGETLRAVIDEQADAQKGLTREGEAPNILVSPDEELLARRAAREIADQVKVKPDMVLGLATGTTPLKTYRELIRIIAAEGIDMSRVRTFNLDEYCGLSATDPQSYHRYMFDNFFSHILYDPAVNPKGIRKEHIHILDGTAPDRAAECRRFEEAITEAGGIDLQILGIGDNGHIGFNEPGSDIRSRTREVTLSPSTRAANARFFGDDPEKVPARSLSMGVGTILAAKKIILLAMTENKADAVAGAAEGVPTTDNPASFLRLHPDASFLLTPVAAGKLSRAAQLSAGAGEAALPLRVAEADLPPVLPFAGVARSGINLIREDLYTHWILTQPEKHLVLCAPAERVARRFTRCDPQTTSLAYTVAYLRGGGGERIAVLAVHEIDGTKDAVLWTWALIDQEGRFIELAHQAAGSLPSPLIEEEASSLAHARQAYVFVERAKERYPLDAGWTFELAGHEWIDIPPAQRALQTMNDAVGAAGAVMTSM